jgi:hypothetical protein
LTRKAFAAAFAILLTISCSSNDGPEPEPTANVSATVEAAVEATVEAIANIDSPKVSELEISGRVRSYFSERAAERSAEAKDFAIAMAGVDDPSTVAVVKEIFDEAAVQASWVTSPQSLAYHEKGVWVVTLLEVLDHEIFGGIDESKTHSVTVCISESGGEPWGCTPK